MNIWSGAISLNEQLQLKDIQLIDQSRIWQSDTLKQSILDFRTFVNPALIPLYARVGPNLELHTNDLESSRWLKHKLLGNIWLEDEDLDRFQTIQCPVGFLVSLDGVTRPRSIGPTTPTDMLVYGVLSTSACYERPPTPPVSSSPACFEESLCSILKQELRIYAIPISGTLVARAQTLPTPDETKEAIPGHEHFPHFLPDLHSPSPKRRRVASLFESVAQHHKRVRHKGGEAVSQLMAQSLSQPSSQQLQSFRVKRESEEPALPILSKIASHRSRSLSISSNLNPNRALESRAELPRPSSNRGHVQRDLASKRGTPAPAPSTEATAQRGSVFSPALLSSEGQESSAEPKDSDTILSENKSTIIRTILTCMRLYGYNRSSRPASSHKPLSHNDFDGTHGELKEGDNVALSTSTSCNGEDEFKAMYHATYRASAFALRKYLREPVMGKDGSRSTPPALEKAKAMTYIDGFLKLFCEEEH